MAERRRVARQEPIIVEVIDGRAFEAHPLPWLERNDLGTEILKQYEESFNETIKAYVDPEGVPMLDLTLNDKLKDPVQILKLAYPKEEDGAFTKLIWAEILELIYASLDVNGHQNLKPLIDPNFLTPTSNGGKNSSGMEKVLSDIRKTRSTPGSGSPASPEKKLSPSPTTKSTHSLTKKTSKGGKTSTGTSH